MKTLSICFATMALAFATASSHALTVDESYAALKAKRFAFDAKSFSYGKAEGESLERMFKLVDQGVVLRAETLRAADAGNVAEVKTLLLRYDALVVSLQKDSAPGALAPVRDRIIEALRDQRKFIADRSRQDARIVHQEFRTSPEIRDASRTLAAARQHLFASFPKAGRANLQAFRASLHALDYF